MWYVNRQFAHTGLIPEPVLRLDDMVLAGDHQKLAEVLTSILKDGVGAFAGNGRHEPREEIKAEVLSWADAEIADLIWGLLKREPEEIIWRYIPRIPDVLLN